MPQMSTEPSDEKSHLFRAVFGLWWFYLVRAQLFTAREFAEQAHALAEESQDAVLLLEARRALGMTLFHLGEFNSARAHLEQAREIYDPEAHSSLALLSAADPGVTSTAYMARTLWHLGYPDQALEMGYDALNLARDLRHPFSEAAALVYAARVHVCRQEADKARELAETAISLSVSQGFPHYIAMSRIIQGWSLAKQGEGNKGIAKIHQGFQVSQNSQMRIARSYFLALLAEAYGEVGQIENGLKVVQEALATIVESKEHQWEAGLNHLKGVLVLNEGKGKARENAEALFLQAINQAHRQDSKSLKLRASVSLARLWLEQNRGEDARGLLSEIVDWFNEGLDTPDLIAARSLLS